MKYIELNSDVLNTQRETLSNQLSNTISNKKFYLGLMDYYSKNIDLLNVELNGNLILINELLDEINKVEEKIELLYVSKSKVEDERDFMLNNYSKIDIEVFDSYRLDYNEMSNILNNLIEERTRLERKYETLLADRKEIVTEIKLNKKHNSICEKNVIKCDYNIGSITKTLNNIDNAYFVSNDKISTRYITPKVKKLKHYCVLN